MRLTLAFAVFVLPLTAALAQQATPPTAPPAPAVVPKPAALVADGMPPVPAELGVAHPALYGVPHRGLLGLEQRATARC